MKVKFFAIMAALLMLGAFAVPASAQYEITNDVIFVRVGYIPVYQVSFDAEGTDDLEFNGFAVQGEYNLNLNPILLGFGMEWQRVVYEEDGNELTAQFINPSVTAKFMTAGGFYFGAGLAGRWNLSNSADVGDDYSKEIDLWANGVIGYFAPVSEYVYIDVQGRFGFNLTNNQWDEFDITDSPDLEASSAYDVAIYVGVGFRATASGL